MSRCLSFLISPLAVLSVDNHPCSICLVLLAQIKYCEPFRSFSLCFRPGGWGGGGGKKIVLRAFSELSLAYTHYLSLRASFHTSPSLSPALLFILSSFPPHGFSLSFILAVFSSVTPLSPFFKPPSPLHPTSAPIAHRFGGSFHPIFPFLSSVSSASLSVYLSTCRLACSLVSLLPP